MNGTSLAASALDRMEEVTPQVNAEIQHRAAFGMIEQGGGYCFS